MKSYLTLSFFKNNYYSKDFFLTLKIFLGWLRLTTVSSARNHSCAMTN